PAAATTSCPSINVILSPLLPDTVRVTAAVRALLAAYSGPLYALVDGPAALATVRLAPGVTLTVNSVWFNCRSVGKLVLSTTIVIVWWTVSITNEFGTRLLPWIGSNWPVAGSRNVSDGKAPPTS